MAENRVQDAEQLFQPENSPNANKDESPFMESVERPGRNGVAPMEQVKSAFTGLSKEELMKYANDPFWVKIRWVLFVSFWIIWALMLFGAIFIVVITKKCDVIVESSWKQSPLYIMDASNVTTKGDGNETIGNMLKGRMNFLREEMGIKNFLLKNALECDESRDYKNISHFFPNMTDFEELIAFTKEKGIRILLSFTPNHSSKKCKLFVYSMWRRKPYEDYYIWNRNNVSNWYSMKGGLAWEQVELPVNNQTVERGFYLHQFGKDEPEFNYHSEELVSYFSSVLQFWLEKGVGGFHLENAQYLAEDATFKNESRALNNQGYPIDTYAAWNHIQTSYLPRTSEVIAIWSKIVANYSGILTASGGDGLNVTDLILRPTTFKANFTADQFHKGVANWMSQVTFPTWQWGCDEPKMEDCFPNTMADALTIVGFTLPGIPVVDYEAEFAPWEGTFIEKLNMASLNGDSHYGVFKNASAMRSSPSIISGKTFMKIYNETIFAFTRIKSGNPGFLIVWNVGYGVTQTLNFSDMPRVSNELTVVVRSIVYGEMYPVGSKLANYYVEIPPMAAIVFRFIPLRD